jgi:hypothetical protein
MPFPEARLARADLPTVGTKAGHRPAPTSDLRAAALVVSAATWMERPAAVRTDSLNARSSVPRE